MIKLNKLIFLALLIIGCSVQKKPEIKITHVLAVTHTGDTLTIPIDVIRPVNYRIINYGGYNYSWPRPYYYDYHRQYNYNQGPSYRSNNNNNNNNNSNDKNINKIVPREDPGDKRPSGDVLLKGKN